MQVSDPDVANVREHNLLSLNLLNVYLLLLESDMLQGYNMPVFIKRIAVRLLLNKLEIAKIYDSTALTSDEIKMLYAAYILGNKLLETSKSEYLSGMILQQLDANHPMKDYNAFRETMLSNNHLLSQFIMQGLAPGMDDFHTWQELVESFIAEHQLS